MQGTSSYFVLVKRVGLGWIRAGFKTAIVSSLSSSGCNRVAAPKHENKIIPYYNENDIR